MKRNTIAMLVAVAASCAAAVSAHAANIVDKWASVKAPPPPALKPVTVDKSYALLVIDMVKETCNEKARPRCMESIPAVEKLLGEARTKGLTVIYTLGTRGKDIVDVLAPKNGEPAVKSGADKFINTDLSQRLIAMS